MSVAESSFPSFELLGLVVSPASVLPTKLLSVAVSGIRPPRGCITNNRVVAVGLQSGSSLSSRGNIREAVVSRTISDKGPGPFLVVESILPLVVLFFVEQLGLGVFVALSCVGCSGFHQFGIKGVDKSIAEDQLAKLEPEDPLVSVWLTPDVLEVEYPLVSVWLTPGVLEVEYPLVSVGLTPDVLDIEYPIVSVWLTPDVLEVEYPLVSVWLTPDVLDFEYPLVSVWLIFDVLDVEDPLVSVGLTPDVLGIEDPLVLVGLSPDVLDIE